MVYYKKNYLDQLEGFLVTRAEDKVYRLKKGLYGLKQVPKAWYEEIAYI